MSPRARTAQHCCALIVAMGCVALAILPRTAQAAFIAFETPNGATTGNQPVDAEASFTTSLDTVHIVLTNDQANPKSAVQCLSGLEFHLSTGQTTGTLTSDTGIDRSIFSGGSYTDSASPVSIGWLLQTVGSDLKLNDLGGDAPEHTIVGPPNASNKYAAGNSSITGGTHNPHVGLTATFDLHVPGVTMASTVTSAIFQFNTAPGNTITGKIVPEPASVGIAGLACLVVGLRRHRG